MLAFQLDKSNLQEEGYTRAVDYWSLGCVVVKLLTGQVAFSNDDILKVAAMSLGSDLSEIHPETPKNCAAIDENAEFSPSSRVGSISPSFALGENTTSIVASPLKAAHMSSKPYLERIFHLLDSSITALPEECFDFIAQLLDSNEKTRLGTGKRGSRKVKAHAFFKDIQWNLLAQKQIPPPFMPGRADLNVNGPPHLSPLTFADMMHELKLEPWLDHRLDEAEQTVFAAW